MKTLELTTTRQFHFEKNAAPAIAAVLVAVDELRAACSKFSGTNDNRAEIELWTDAIKERVGNLLNVNGDDAEALAASIAWGEQSNRLLGFMRNVMLYKPALASGDDGESRPLVKKIRRSIDAAYEHIGAFAARKDTRELIIVEIEKIMSFVPEVLLFDEPMDRWQLGLLTQRCDAFLRALREPLRTEPAPAPGGAAIYPKHQRLSDELDELLNRLRRLSDLEDAKLAILKAGEARRAACAAIFNDQLDVQAMTANLQEIQSDIRRFTAPPDALPAVVAGMRGSVQYASEQLGKVLAILGPAVLAPPPPAVTVASRIGRALARAN